MTVPHAVDFCYYMLRFHKCLLMSLSLKQNVKHNACPEIAQSARILSQEIGPNHWLF